MATGFARGAKEKGKRIAFGDGRKIIWDKHSPMMFRDNPNIARPNDRRAGDLDWVPFYVGHRLYNRRDDDRWIWNYEFKARPGELFFSIGELDFARSLPAGFVLIEPNVPQFKTVATNKTWPFERYQALANRLGKRGVRVRQFHYEGANRLVGAEGIVAPTFRHALAALGCASLYIGPEGGLHHGAAAVGVPAVVLFGGFIPPQVTGYDGHVNLTGGAEACGSMTPCQHCAHAMRAISMDEVEAAAVDLLARG